MKNFYILFCLSLLMPLALTSQEIEEVIVTANKKAETVQEIPITILPYYNIETGWSIRGGWLINNYRGRNQTLGIIGSFGGLNTYGLKFKDPWIFGNHISFGLNLTKAFYSHIFLNKAISSNGGSMAVGKWFRDKIKTNAVIKIENKEFSNDEKISLVSVKLP